MRGGGIWDTESDRKVGSSRQLNLLIHVFCPPLSQGARGQQEGNGMGIVIILRNRDQNRKFR